VVDLWLSLFLWLLLGLGGVEFGLFCSFMLLVSVWWDVSDSLFMGETLKTRLFCVFGVNGRRTRVLFLFFWDLC
jgi:hypothetical protein